MMQIAMMSVAPKSNKYLMAAIKVPPVANIIAICIISSPEGIKAVGDAFPNTNVHLVTGAVDEKLNEHGYIVPGLGDAGDRLYGVV